MPDDPLVPPSVGIFDGPVHKLCINAEWWAHISGEISRLLYRDAWAGTDTQIEDAVQSIYRLLNVGEPTDDCEGLP